MRLTSTAFEDGADIPEKFTADGENVSPPLEWSDIPEGTVCFVLTAEDPDAPATPSGCSLLAEMPEVPGEATPLPEGVAPHRMGMGVPNPDGNDMVDRLGYEGGTPEAGERVSPAEEMPETFTHWILYDLPAETVALPEGVPAEGKTPEGAKQGLNDFEDLGYGGPAPPQGPAHRYVFQLLAVDKETGLHAGVELDRVREAIQGHVLAKAQLTGKYGR